MALLLYAPFSTRLGSLFLVLLLLGGELVRLTWVDRRHALFSSMLAWAVVWAVCCRISRKQGRFAGAGTVEFRRRKVLLSAACIWLAGICERSSASGAFEANWTKAGVPAVIYLFRILELGVAVGGGGGEPKETSRIGSGRLVFITTAAAAVALVPVATTNAWVALGTCNVVFTALGYAILEDTLIPAEENEYPAKTDVWDGYLILGKEMAFWLTLAFAGASVAFENFHLEAWSNGYSENNSNKKAFENWLLIVVRVCGIGLLEGLWWMMIPLVMSRFTAAGVGFLELTAELLVGIATSFSLLKAFSFLGAMGGITAYFTLSPFVADHHGLSPYRMRGQHVTFLLIFLFVAVGTYLLGTSETSTPLRSKAQLLATSDHPIPRLIQAAENTFAEMQSRQSKSLSEAVSNYRKRYGMNPPPNFDQWYWFAKSRNAVVIDDYDTIYHSLKPFWGLAPQEVRARAREIIGFREPIGLNDNRLLHVSIRDGASKIDGQGAKWQKEATDGMMKGFVQFLPDMDLAFNIHDEPRIVVPHDQLSKYLSRANEKVFSLGEAKNVFTPLSNEERAPIPECSHTRFNVFAHQPIWSHAKQSCPPDSPVQSVDDDTPDETDGYSVQPLGFIKNQTHASDICFSPSLEKSHGFFERPNAFNVAHALLPVFSQSKMSSFNDILYPSPWYWAGRVKYIESRDTDWSNKNNTLYWRGSTTGGFSRSGGWKFQHRQRAVTKLNANDTAKVLEQMHRGGTGPWSVKDVDRHIYSPLFDVRFSHVGQCDGKDCDDQRDFFDIAPPADFQDAWNSKYLLDLDGNAFSGRFYAFLQSNSAVFKQAMFREWHEELLIPWVHFVPVSMQMEEVAEMIKFFDGTEEGRRLVKRIAEQGREWAGKVLRKEDFEVWFFRALLEYGRVVDDNRDNIGFSG